MWVLLPTAMGFIPAQILLPVKWSFTTEVKLRKCVLPFHHIGMMIKSLFCKTPQQFASTLTEAIDLAATADAVVFLLFSGTKQNGISWCGDCVRAEPMIQQAFAGYAEPFVLVTCDVDREPYRTAEYPYRVDPALHLR